MLQNAYFLAKIGADTAENEQHFAETFVAALRGRESVGTLVYFEFRARGEPPHLVAAYLGQRLENAGLPFSECGLFENAFSKTHFSKTHFSKILQIFGGLVLGCTSYGARPQARAVNLSLMIN